MSLHTRGVLFVCLVFSSCCFCHEYSHTERKYYAVKKAIFLHHEHEILKIGIGLGVRKFHKLFVFSHQFFTLYLVCKSLNKQRKLFDFMAKRCKSLHTSAQSGTWSCLASSTDFLTLQCYERKLNKGVRELKNNCSIILKAEKSRFQCVVHCYHYFPNYFQGYRHRLIFFGQLLCPNTYTNI